MAEGIAKCQAQLPPSRAGDERRRQAEVREEEHIVDLEVALVEEHIAAMTIAQVVVLEEVQSPQLASCPGVGLEVLYNSAPPGDWGRSVGYICSS